MESILCPATNLGTQVGDRSTAFTPGVLVDSMEILNGVLHKYGGMDVEVGV